jgi:tungstate transport system substrate-binding protein
MKNFFLPLLVVFLTSLTACSTASSTSSKLLLVSTTSTQDSGLLDVLLPAFTEQTGYEVNLIATGSGQALKIAEEGNADVILLHSPTAEKEFMDKGFGIDRRPVMHNDFVIVGPASDPASVRTRTSAVDSMKAIFASASTFVSRGDDSGTHVKELALWKNAGLEPFKQSWYLETGQGQGATLGIASEKGAYALTDRGTFLAYQANLDLVILFENDPILLNVYHVITVNPEKWPQVNGKGARAFADFVTSQTGQDIIRNFGVEQYGQPLFYPDADKTDADLGLP